MSEPDLTTSAGWLLEPCINQSIQKASVQTHLKLSLHDRYTSKENLATIAPLLYCNPCSIAIGHHIYSQLYLILFMQGYTWLHMEIEYLISKYYHTQQINKSFTKMSNVWRAYSIALTLWWRCDNIKTLSSKLNKDWLLHSLIQENIRMWRWVKCLDEPYKVWVIQHLLDNCRLIKSFQHMIRNTIALSKVNFW